MGEWSVGQWIVGVISFQKIFGLYGVKHHIVEISGDVTDAGRDEQTTSKDSATQLLISEPLSLAMKGKGRIYFNFKVFAHWSVIDHPL